MSVKRTICPECGETDVEVTREINPETTDLNMKVELKCPSCSHTWEGHVTSHYTRQQFNAGRIRL